jgi:two-component system KDP operon response regulator KdpE
MTDPSAAPGSGSPSPSPDAGTVLIVEDDPSMAEILTTALGARGYTVVVTRSADAAIRVVTDRPPDVVLLDLGLPDMDGLEVCRRVRQYSQLPVIVLTADGDEARKVTALDLGADDYVTKPFSTPELMARVRVALRRTSQPSPAAVSTTVLEVGGLRIDSDVYEVTLRGEPLRLTHKEFLLLRLLVERVGSLVPRDHILAEVWGDGGSPESLRVHVTNLRRKLGDHGGVEIRTEPGLGYRLVESTA